MQSLDGIRSQAERAIAPQVVALWAFCGVAAFVGLLVVGQALARRLGAEAGDNLTLDAMGMTHRDRFEVAAVDVLVIGLMGGAVALLTTWLLSPLAPIGAARLAEPDPGFRPTGGCSASAPSGWSSRCASSGHGRPGDRRASPGAPRRRRPRGWPRPCRPPVGPWRRSPAFDSHSSQAVGRGPFRRGRRSSAPRRPYSWSSRSSRSPARSTTWSERRGCTARPANRIVNFNSTTRRGRPRADPREGRSGARREPPRRRLDADLGQRSPHRRPDHPRRGDEAGHTAGVSR